MAGLFDFLSQNPAITQGLLAGAFGALAGRGTRAQAWGQGGLAALQGYGQGLNQQASEQERQMQAKRAQIQEQMLSMQLQQAQEAQKGKAATQSYLAQALSPVAPIGANAASGVAGPRPEALQAVGQMPGFSLEGALKAGVPLEMIPTIQQTLQGKPDDYKVVGDSLVRIGSKGVQPVYTAPKEEDLTKLIIRGPDGKPMINQMAFDVQKTLREAGRPSTTVSVNTGQKGFDNTLKLRGDFRSEPIYKAHQEMQSAYSQIQQSLKQASPAGDLAGATKIMKLLDPGSVVRESELGMAMAASGLMDRVQNYASMIMAGTKLTPTQRKDFQTLADALYKESVNQYNAKRAEYKGIAERNQLNEADVLGSEAAAPLGVVNFSDLSK